MQKAWRENGKLYTYYEAKKMVSDMDFQKIWPMLWPKRSEIYKKLHSLVLI